MSININVVSHMSNKSYEIVDTSGNFIVENTTNNIINIPYDTSYIMYIEPESVDIGYTSMLDISSTFLSGIFGYIFIFVIGILFYLVLRMVKQYV